MNAKPLNCLCVRPLLLALLCLGVTPAFAQGAKKSTVPPRRVVRSPWDVEAREYLGTPQAEAAVERGLAYLATHQEADGHWRSGNYSNEVGITALCLIAYLSAGNQPGRGKYGLVMNLAVDYLANNVHLDGQVVPPGFINTNRMTGSPMYGHGFALLALSEAYGMTRRADLKPKLEAAIHLIEDTQNQDGTTYRDGGWRYQPMQGDADLSVTVVQVLSLRACRNAGLKVSQQTLDRAIAYMRRAANPDGSFSYQIGSQQSNPARAGAGSLSLMMAGLRDSKEVNNALAYLQAHPLDPNNEWPYREHFYYGIYYITQAMYQAGGDYWRRWYPAIRERLVTRQDPDGSWSQRDRLSEAGAPYATAMSVLVLQVPAGLLPIYQK